MPSGCKIAHSIAAPHNALSHVRFSLTHLPCETSVHRHDSAMDHTVTHACGHQQIHHVLGFTQQQLRKVAMLEAAPCDSCRRTAKQASSKAASDKQVAALEQFALASLSGSPRQVAWAESIRVTRLTSLLADHGDGTPDACRSCAAITEAKWWIDHRHLPSAKLAARAVAAATLGMRTVAAAA